MKVAFAAGDVGGARAILPVARAAANRGLHVVGMRHGVLHSEGDPAWIWREPVDMTDQLFWSGDGSPDALVYATSVADDRAINVACAAKESTSRVVHVLDNWSSYGTRLLTSTGRRCDPDLYVVMDELAFEAALADGVDRACLRVTGHPGLGYLIDEEATLPGPGAAGPLQILFVSEPARADSGGANDPGWRGYDEQLVTELVAAGLIATNLDPTIRIAPHPREDRGAVQHRWERLTSGSGLSCSLVPPNEVRAALHSAHGVIGMSSILLYEGWLLQKSVLSVQPDLNRSDLSVLGERSGLDLCVNGGTVTEAVASLLERASPVTKQDAPHSELVRHSQAAERVLQLALSTPSS